jgi:hypothetical protein
MKQFKIILGLVLLASVSTFAQSPRIKLNQITKDTVKGSVLISSPSDSGMVYSRDFYIAYGVDTVLILYGDTLAATSGTISSVLSDGVTITGNGTSGSELKADTSIIATIKALNDSLATVSASTEADGVTITGAGTVADPLKVDTATISTIQGLVDSLLNYVTLAGTETITGAKTFTSDLNIDAKIALNNGDNNIVIGDGAGASLVSGQAVANILIGTGAGNSINSGFQNIANGYQALYNNNTGNNNVAVGYLALYNNTVGYYNVANGFLALYNNLGGVNNVANGSFSLYNLSSGSNNQAYGTDAGHYLSDGSTPLTTADGSLFIGSNTRASANGNSNEIVIGTNAIGNGSNTITIGSSTTQSLHTRNYEFDIDQTVGGATDNYVLTYDSLDGQISLEPASGGTATIPVDTFVTIAGTETITGAKTFTNTFTQSGGDANFDNNTLYVDESANRVGIGKNNPSYKLDVNGNVNSEIKYIKLRRDSNLTLSATDTLTWDNTVAKDDDIFSHTSGQEEIYADVAGLYHITVNLNFVNDNNVERSTVRARLAKNTTVQTHSAGYTYLRGQNGHINGTITISDMIELSTNDYIYVIIDKIDSDGSGETLIATESEIIMRRLGY